VHADAASDATSRSIDDDSSDRPLSQWRRRRCTCRVPASRALPPRARTCVSSVQVQFMHGRRTYVDGSSGYLMTETCAWHGMAWHGHGRARTPDATDRHRLRFTVCVVGIDELTMTSAPTVYRLIDNSFYVCTTSNQRTVFTVQYVHACMSARPPLQAAVHVGRFRPVDWPTHKSPTS
jgi:hypothetical protein